MKKVKSDLKLLKLSGIALALILGTLPLIVKTQSLTEIYKKDKILLEEVPDYANKNNWEKLFPDAGKVEFDKKTGLSKGIVVAPDGSVFMSHQTLYEIWKFDKNGNFLKKFGSHGSKPGQFLFHFSLYGMLEGKYIFTSDCQGRMLFFDTEGKFIKKLQLDYMPLDIVPLGSSKIAILGFVVGKNNKDILSIKDFNTGKEKIIWSQVAEDPDKSGITIKLPKGGIMTLSIPYSHSSYTRIRLAASKTGNLIVGTPDNGNIIEYSPEGIKLKSFASGITPLTISEEDINQSWDDYAKKISQSTMFSAEDKKEVINQYKSQIGKFKDRSLYPKHLPYFSSLITDSDGNILVFEFTKDETNKFRVYAFDASGKEIGSSSFVSKEYDISFIPSTFSFGKGYIYAVALKKNGGKVPVRLVKFRLG
jgi:hypothetical protein